MWALGLLLAVAVCTLLPDPVRVTPAATQGSPFIPRRRIGFLTCLLAALSVRERVGFRAPSADAGLNGRPEAVTGAARDGKNGKSRPATGQLLPQGE